MAAELRRTRAAGVRSWRGDAGAIIAPRRWLCTVRKHLNAHAVIISSVVMSNETACILRGNIGTGPTSDDSGIAWVLHSRSAGATLGATRWLYVGHISIQSKYSPVQWLLQINPRRSTACVPRRPT